MRQLWQAMHHGRTLYGHTCKSLGSFFSALDKVSPQRARRGKGWLFMCLCLPTADCSPALYPRSQDGSATVTIPELETAFKRLDVTCNANTLAAVLRTIDTSSSGTIERDEFEKWMRFWHGTRRVAEHEWLTSKGVRVVRKIHDVHQHDALVHERLHRTEDERDKARREVSERDAAVAGFRCR